MKLHTIETGFFKLDGGAMFGVVPKSIWQKNNPADDNNMCTWAMRCLLIESDNRLILIDTGIGNKQDAKFLSHFYLHGDDTLLGSIKNAGFEPEDITDVFFTHLHFDHCGGAVKWSDPEKKIAELVFTNARHWTNLQHWQWATHANPREKASFLSENLLPIESSGQLFFIENQVSPFEEFDILFADGHTMQMMVPLIKMPDRSVVFAADLLPSTGHIPLPYVMSYDVQPLKTMQEKAHFLERAVEENFVVFLEHDPKFACCTLQKTEKGVRLDRTGNLTEFINN
ncbi:MAG: MBL fold metallo-hydrolase [Cyclobacteriaceae bacterium]